METLRPFTQESKPKKTCTKIKNRNYKCCTKMGYIGLRMRAPPKKKKKSLFSDLKTQLNFKSKKVPFSIWNDMIDTVEIDIRI